VQLLDDELVLSPTDLTSFAACERLTQLELAVTRGELERPQRDDPELDVLTRHGELHEAERLEQFKTEGRSVVEIANHVSGRADLERAEADTLAAMRAGAGVIYQATFFDGLWRGHADYLLRVEEPSDLGAWSYEVADAKLAQRVKAAALLQMCAYSEQVERLQGVAPRQMHVITGDKLMHPFRVADYAAYYRSLKTRYLLFVADPGGEVYPDPVDHCGICRWEAACDQRRRDDDHLSLVARMGRDQTRKLLAARIDTMTSLAESNIAVPGIGEATLERLRDQARLQVEGAGCRPPKFALLAPEPPDASGQDRGLAGLPSPSPGDLFFDMEGDPWALDGGLEYLFGVVDNVGGAPEYRAFWGHDLAGEQRAFEAFIDFVTTRRVQYPDAHVYHYAAYEQTAVKRLMGKYGTREDEVDALLRGGAFVDLYRVVLQSVQISTEGYGLKKIEALYMERDVGAVADGGSSIVAYERYLESDDPREREKILDEIAEYNCDDCESTRLLRAWLEARRPEAEREFGEIPRPAERDSVPSERVAEHDAKLEAIEKELAAGVGEPDERSEAEHARWLLAQLLHWYRREARPEWWAFFRRLHDLSGDEFVDDAECIGGLDYEGEVGPVKQSTVHRYKFVPQDHKFGIGVEPVDPATAKAAGTVFDIDDEHGTIDLKRGKNSDVPHPRNLIAGGPFSTAAQEDAVATVGRWVVEHGIEGPGPYRAARDLLVRRAPRIQGVEPGAAIRHEGERLIDTAVRVAARLDDTCLAVQGPPGSGKTYAGAHMIVELLRRGCRVGVTANSHAVIGTLLEEIFEVADDKGVTPRALQKCDPERNQHCGIDAVESTTKAHEVVSGINERDINLVAGTAWLFACDDMADTLDVLFVDEAGQMSLANAVAVSRAARNIVLLGDPRQLAQPGNGTHPEGAGASALGHMLGEHETMPADLGLFLDTTYRMHPEVCQFISEVSYEGRLHSEPSLERQRVDGAGESLLIGSGLRFVPVRHAGDRSSSTDEAFRVATLLHGLIGRTWIDKDGVEAELELQDVLIVAPYNAQVACLGEQLPEGARVGTVDKFQGQEAAVAIYSMATSSAEDVSRTIEFLYDLHRLNVAVSRARALSIIVCSPELLRLHCRNPEQMRLVNALCLYEECAAPTRSARPGRRPGAAPALSVVS
jgi:predicted RecB family nuclease